MRTGNGRGWSVLRAVVVILVVAACSGHDGGHGAPPPDTVVTGSTGTTTDNIGAGPASSTAGDDVAGAARAAPAASGAATACASAPDGEPATVTTLHFWDDRVLGLVEVAAAEFEARHPGVELRFEKSRGGADALALLAAQPVADRAEVVVLPDMSTASAIGLGAFEPVERCGPPAGSFMAAPRAVYTVDGTLWAAPFTVSAPVLFYDREAFVTAGLDPDDPPGTVDELAAAARQIVTTGAREVGLVLETGAFSGGVWYVEQFAAQIGQVTLEPGNGRAGPVERVAWDQPAVVGALSTLRGLVSDGTAEVIDAGDGFADLLRLVAEDRPAAMSVHTSGSLGAVLELMAAQGQADRVGIAPLPAVDASVAASALAGGAALWLTAGQAPTEAAAAQAWIAFLASPEVQARVAASGGFVPAAVGTAALQEYEEAVSRWPQLLVAAGSLLPATNPAQVPPLHPAWEDLRYVLAGAVHTILVDGADASSTLAAAEREASPLLAGG